MNALLRALVATSVLALAGCTTLQPGAPPSVAELPTPQPPIVSDRFLLPTDGTRIVGALQEIEARHDDTFVDIARAYNLGFDELVEANPGVDPWLPGEGTRVLLPTRFILPDAPAEGIVINLAHKRLFYYPPADEQGVRAVVTYPIGIGREGRATPEGRTTVTSKGKDPVWFPTASIRRDYAAQGNPLPSRVPPGPDNPLGGHVLVLGMPSYLIHGTNKPAGVGMRVSYGCVRLFPENIEHLYKQVPLKTPVTIVNQPWLAAWDGDALYLEVHTVLEDDARDWSLARLQRVLADVLAAEESGWQLDEDQLAAQLDRADGVPARILGGGDDDAPMPQPLWVHNLTPSISISPQLAAQAVGQIVSQAIND